MQKGSSSETTDGGHTWSDAHWGDVGRGEFLNRFRLFGNPVTVVYASGDTVYKYSVDPVPVAPQIAAELEALLFDDTEPIETSPPARLHITVPPDVSRLSINIFDRFGDHVRHLTQETQPAPGQRVIEWNVTDDNGESLDAGYYIVRATADNLSDSQLLWVSD